MQGLLTKSLLTKSMQRLLGEAAKGLTELWKLTTERVKVVCSPQDVIFT